MHPKRLGNRGGTAADLARQDDPGPHGVALGAADRSDSTPQFAALFHGQRNGDGRPPSKAYAPTQSFEPSNSNFFRQAGLALSAPILRAE